MRNDEMLISAESDIGLRPGPQVADKMNQVGVAW
jgi:hypothetical protein